METTSESLTPEGSLSYGFSPEEGKVSLPSRNLPAHYLENSLGIGRDQEVRDRAIADCEGFARTIVHEVMRRYNMRKSHLRDLMSAAMLGLVEAATRYDPDRGYSFRAYAYFRIRGAVIDQIREQNYASGRGAAAIGTLREFADVRQRLREKESRDHGTLRARADALRAKAAKAELVYQVSLSELAEHTATEQYAVEVTTPEDVILERERKSLVHRLIATLPAREREIVKQVYFTDRTFGEIAQDTDHVSRSWLSRIHLRAIGRLRTLLKKVEQHRAQP